MPVFVSLCVCVCLQNNDREAARNNDIDCRCSRFSFFGLDLTGLLCFCVHCLVGRLSSGNLLIIFLRTTTLPVDGTLSVIRSRSILCSFERQRDLSFWYVSFRFDYSMFSAMHDHDIPNTRWLYISTERQIGREKETHENERSKTLNRSNSECTKQNAIPLEYSFIIYHFVISYLSQPSSRIEHTHTSLTYNFWYFHWWMNCRRAKN